MASCYYKLLLQKSHTGNTSVSFSFVELSLKSKS